MKIQVTQEINVPSGFYCNGNGQCYRRSQFEEQNHTYHVCGVFGQYLKEESWSGKIIKCQKCIDETMKHINLNR